MFPETSLCMHVRSFIYLHNIGNAAHTLFLHLDLSLLGTLLWYFNLTLPVSYFTEPISFANVSVDIVFNERLRDFETLESK